MSGLRSFLRRVADGVVLVVVVSALGNLWLVVDQRAEARKPEPWRDPSFTTAVITNGGPFSRWMDGDGNLANGHSYVRGIYDFWKGQHPDVFIAVVKMKQVDVMPQFWAIEFAGDLSKMSEQDVERLMIVPARQMAVPQPPAVQEIEIDVDALVRRIDPEGKGGGAR